MVRRAILVLTLMVLIPVSLYYGIRAGVVFSKGYSWQEMDWDSDGQTTIGEFYESSDVETQSVEKDTSSCTQYFSMKDASILKEKC